MLIFGATIGLAMILYNIFTNDYFDYTPYWVKMTFGILFFLAWAKFMEIVGNDHL